MSSIDRVGERLSRDHRDIIWQKPDLAAWCYEVVNEVGLYEAFEETVIDVPVGADERVPLPCNLYRLLSVSNACDQCAQVVYTRKASCIYVKNCTTTNVRLHAIVFKVDEDGYPIIDEQLESACYWYCLRKLLQDAYYKGHVPAQQYEDTKAEYRQAVHHARASLVGTTVTDLREITSMLRSMIVTTRNT